MAYKTVGEEAAPKGGVVDSLLKVGENLLTSLGNKVVGVQPTPVVTPIAPPSNPLIPVLLIGGIGIAAYMILRK